MEWADLLEGADGDPGAVRATTTGDANACTGAAIDALASLVGGAVGRLAAKYGVPWKWHKLKKLVDDLWNLGGRAFKALDNLLDARKILGKRRKEIAKSTDELAKACKLAGRGRGRGRGRVPARGPTFRSWRWPNGPLPAGAFTT